MACDWLWSIEREIQSDTDVARDLLEEVLGQLNERGWPEEDKFGVHLSVEEALMNAIKHGNQRDPEKKVFVQVRLADSLLYVSVEDEGEGFNPEDVPDPTLDENLELPSGRGLMLMRTFMSMVEYNDKGNRVRMEKQKSAGDPPAE
jgi:serine/threonine-protein kinase RsbW